jgi:copper chaperone CopZ
VDYGDRRAASDVAVSPVKCTDECCAPTRSRPRWLQALRYGFLVLPADLTKPMLAGIFIAGVIGAFVPPDFFAGTALGRGWSGMLVMMAVGIPIYVCATASVPIAASLIATGISPGAALVFLMTGPATNGATIATLWKMLGRKTALIYLAVIGCAALAFGALLDLFIRAHPAGGHAHGHSMIPPAVQCGSAILLLAILLAPLIPRLRRAAAVELPAAESVATQLTVTGMTCSHCAETVARALRECPGVTAVTVDLASGRAVVQGRASDVAALIAAVESVGYKAQSRS